MTFDIEISKELKDEMLAFAVKYMTEHPDEAAEDETWFEFDTHWDINAVFYGDPDKADGFDLKDYALVAYPTVRTGENQYSTLTNSWVVLREHKGIYSD